MEIKLNDREGIEYKLFVDDDGEGRFIRFHPHSANDDKEWNTDHDLCLDNDEATELIKTLQFLLDFVDK